MTYSITQERAKIYAFKTYFSPLQAGAIMLDIDPNLVNLNDRQDLSLSNVHLLSEILMELAENNKFKDVIIGYPDIGSIGSTEYIESISAEELKRWALSNGYHWLSSNDTVANNDEFQNQLSTKDEEIARLKAEITELKKANQQIVDYENYSIYGHTTEPISAIFAVINRFWVNADLSQPDTIANAEDIEEWIAEKYPSISNTIKQAIQKITRPERAKSIGRKS